MTVSKAPTDLKHQTPSQEGTPENRPPPLEDAQIHVGASWPEQGKMSGNLFETRKDWLIPPNYNNDNNMNTAIATSSKSPIRTTNQQSNGKKMWMGTKLPLLQKHRRRLGW